MQNLNVGSGSRPMNGKLFNKPNEWLDLDIRKEVKSIHGFVYKPDIIADVRKIPVKDNTFNELLVHSVLEHFSKWEYQNCLKEWYRVLIPGGKVTIGVPDIFSVAKLILVYKNANNLKAIKSLINLLYGEQNYEGNLHKHGYIEETLREL